MRHGHPSRRLGGILGAILALAPVAAAALSLDQGPWLDAGASRPPPLGGSLGPSSNLAYAGWRDAGAGEKANREAVDRARWAAWKTGALMAAEWRSDKLSNSPDAPFDTWLLVFSPGESGVQSVGEYTRGADAPTPLAVYELIRGKDLVLLSRRETGSRDFAQPFATLRREAGAWVAETATSVSRYSLLADGALAIDREVYGSRLGERYAPGGTATFTEDGVLARRGSFEAKPEFGVAQWTERPAEGGDQVETAYWYDSIRDDRLAFSVGDAEPIAEARFEGASALTAGSGGLEGLAIADTILGSSRRATPVLAWALLGRLPPRD